MKTPYCQSCWLFGDPQAMQKEWAGGVSSNPKNFGMKIKSHEKTHLMRAYIIHTIRNTRNIRKTTLLICDRLDRGPNGILSTGPRVRRDATAVY